MKAEGKTTRARLPRVLAWLVAGIEIVFAAGLVLALGVIVLAWARSGADPLEERKAFGFIGAIDAGVFEIALPEGSYSISYDGKPAEGIRLEEVRAKVELADPAIIRDFTGRLAWRFLGFGLWGFLWVVALDFMRRLFRNVARGECFTEESVKLVRKIGITMVVVAITGKWLHTGTLLALESFVTERISSAGVTILGSVEESALGSSFFLSLVGARGVVFGLAVLAIGEAFRQGLKLKEESDLTI